MTNYFYTDTSGQKQGPIDDQQLQALAEQGMITPETVLEADSGHKGLAGQVLGLKFNTAVSTTASPFGEATSDAPSPFAQPAQMLPAPESNRTLFTVSLIGMAGGLLSFVAGGSMLGTGNDDFAGFLCTVGFLGFLAGMILFLVFGFKRCVLGLQRWAATPVSVEKLDGYFKGYWICALIEGTLFLLCSGTFGCIVGMVFQFMLLYKLWKLVPADIARTPPGKALGFCFIPFFNFYWIFVAYKGLGEDMNKTLARRGITYRISGALGMCSPILMLLSIIPLVGIFSFIVQFFFLKSVKNGAILMLKQAGQ